MLVISIVPRPQKTTKTARRVSTYFLYLLINIISNIVDSIVKLFQKHFYFHLTKYIERPTKIFTGREKKHPKSLESIALGNLTAAIFNIHILKFVIFLGDGASVKLGLSLQYG